MVGCSGRFRANVRNGYTQNRTEVSIIGWTGFNPPTYFTERHGKLDKWQTSQAASRAELCGCFFCLLYCFGCPSWGH